MSQAQEGGGSFRGESSSSGGTVDRGLWPVCSRGAWSWSQRVWWGEGTGAGSSQACEVPGLCLVPRALRTLPGGKPGRSIGGFKGRQEGSLLRASCCVPLGNVQNSLRGWRGGPRQGLHGLSSSFPTIRISASGENGICDGPPTSPAEPSLRPTGPAEGPQARDQCPPCGSCTPGWQW